MDMIPVVSSNIRAIGYEAKTKTLYVSFVKGGTYSYSGVSAHVHSDLMNAPSKGKYFAANIRKSYPYRRIG